MAYKTTLATVSAAAQHSPLWVHRFPVLMIGNDPAECRRWYGNGAKQWDDAATITKYKQCTRFKLYSSLCDTVRRLKLYKENVVKCIHWRGYWKLDGKMAFCRHAPIVNVKHDSRNWIIRAWLTFSSTFSYSYH